MLDIENDKLQKAALKNIEKREKLITDNLERFKKQDFTISSVEDLDNVLNELKGHSGIYIFHVQDNVNFQDLNEAFKNQKGKSDHASPKVHKEINLDTVKSLYIGMRKDGKLKSRLKRHIEQENDSYKKTSALKLRSWFPFDTETLYLTTYSFKNTESRLSSKEQSILLAELEVAFKDLYPPLIGV